MKHITEFTHNTLPDLQPYFDLKHSDVQWWLNLLNMAKHSLGVAHCVQHNQIARLAVEMSMPSFNIPFDRKIGCWSGPKSTDTVILDQQGRVSGSKTWISLLNQADYGVFKFLDHTGQQVLVLFDFTQTPCDVNMDVFNPIGMELAKPGTLTFDPAPAENILGYENSDVAREISNFASYSFITNYVGLAEGLYQELVDYTIQHKISVDYELRKLNLELSSLRMMWQDNLNTVTSTMTDQLWHRRNTQYAQGKNFLLKLIQIILELGISYFLDACSPYSQRFRDALMLTSHMQSLYKNTNDLIFVRQSVV